MPRRKKSLPPIPKPLFQRETQTKKLLVPAVEQALINHLAGHEFRSSVVWTAGRGQLAAALSNRGESSLFVMDNWLSRQCQAFLERESAGPVQVFCQPDWPTDKHDLAVIALSKSDSKELLLELFQSAWLGLESGGKLVVAGEKSAEAWLRKSLSPFSKSIQAKVHRRSIVLAMESTGELSRPRSWECELAFRDSGNLVKLLTRPGVFAHRKMDNGARQLLECVQLEPGAKVLDIGCGSGAVSLGLAMRDPSIEVLAVDSHSRAVECTQRGAELNGLKNVQTLCADDGDYGYDGQFDVALGNPPYYSGFRISEIFCTAASRNLRPGGRAILVTKTPEWYQNRLPEFLDNVEIFKSGRYHIATGIARDAK